MILFLLQLFLIAVLLIILGVMILNLLSVPFYAYAMIRGAFYAPSNREKVKTMLKLAQGKKIKKMVDIGSGDGRIVAAFAETGVEATGLEINPLLVLRSRWLLRRRGLAKKAEIHLKDFWHVDLGSYDLVTVYGIKHIMSKLEQKLDSDLKKGTLVLSNGFPLPNWKPVKKENGVFVYKK